MREYDISGQQTQDPLGFNGSNRGYGFASAVDDIAGSLFFGDPDASSNIWAELSGYNSQQREFQQQEYLLEKEQQWSSEGARMARLKAAGVNPLTAAAGLAGSQGSAAAPAVSNATGAPAAGLGSASSLLNSIGSSRQAFAEASFKDATEDPTIKNIIADTEDKATRAGYNKEQAQNLAISNLFLPREKALGLIALRKNLDLMDSQRDLYIAQKEHFGSLIKEIDEHIEVMKAERNLIATQEAVEKKRGLLLDQQAFELKWQNDIRTMFKIDPTQPVENNTFLLWLQKSPLYNSSLDFIQEINYKRFTGQYSAQADKAFDIAYEEGRAAYDFNWSSPPKTVSEFVWKTFDNLKGKLNSFKGLFTTSESSSDNSYKVSKDDLYKSYQIYMQQRANLAFQINLMIAEKNERFGNDRVKGADMQIEINKLQSEYSKMPKTFREFKKYVSNLE